MSRSRKPSTRRRGGQPGNANALRHGLYSSQQVPFELKDPAQIPVTDLHQEIETLRLLLGRYSREAEARVLSGEMDPRELLLTYAFVSAQLAAMVRAQSRALRFNRSNNALQAWIASLPSGEEDAE